jgi:hypothetical protein
MHLRILQLAILTAVLTTQAEDSPPDYQNVLIGDVPHVLQKPDFCGEASAAMYLSKLGESMDQDYVFDRSAVDPSEGRGSDAAELAAALIGIGFEVGDVWMPLEREEQLEEQFRAMHDDLLHGIPSIVCMRTSARDEDEHFRLVLGYDPRDDSVIFHEPADADGSYRRMAKEEFLELWALQGRFQWGVIRLRLEPGDLEYGDEADGRTAADYAQHVMRLRDTVPEGFTVVVQRPFVVISDAHRVEVMAHATRTVARTVELLKGDLFERDPGDIIDIWLFEDSESYGYHSKTLFGHPPDTPYGYYSDRHKAIVLDISTGGGTLVHEIVHPFVNSDFPDCPAWLNEGLASLYEYPTTRDGHIRGLINWRLPGLKTAIINGELPSFEWLMSRTDAQFYGEDPGTNYSQARYLAYWLQERELLVEYYREFRARHEGDPTGLETFGRVAGVGDMIAFQREWQQWVMGLRIEE